MKLQKACVSKPEQTVRSGKLVLYLGSTAFYMTFFYIWKCSFWLLCRPWYLFIYFGLDYRPLVRQSTILQWLKCSRKFWCFRRSSRLRKYVTVFIRTPYTVVQITVWLAFVGALRLPAALKRHLGGVKSKHSTECTAGLSLEEQLLFTYPDDFQILAQHNGKLVLYKNLPLRQISHYWGKFVNLPHFPAWFRVLALKFYIWLYGCKLQEAQNQDLKSYKSLGDFFRRPLRKEVRPIYGGNCVVSPSDGCIMQCGTVNNGLLEQVKGVNFPLRCFLGPVYDEDSTTSLCFKHVIKKSLCQRKIDIHSNGHSGLDMVAAEMSIDTLTHKQFQSVVSKTVMANVRHALHYCVVYLSPGDYHRFHSPVDWTVSGRRHFTGNLYSVKPAMAAWLQGLFCVNERAMYVGRWKYGFFSMTAVGALNVGSINVFFDKDLKTNNRDHEEMGVFQDASFVTKKQKSVSLTKGQLMGDFNLGSTIVLMFEAPYGFDFNILQGNIVKYGQCIGK